MGTQEVTREAAPEPLAAATDEVLVLDFGKVVAAGQPAEVLASDVVRRAYLGSGDELGELESLKKLRGLRRHHVEGVGD